MGCYSEMSTAAGSSFSEANKSSSSFDSFLRQLHSTEPRCEPPVRRRSLHSPPRPLQTTTALKAIPKTERGMSTFRMERGGARLTCQVEVSLDLKYIYIFFFFLKVILPFALLCTGKKGKKSQWLHTDIL